MTAAVGQLAMTRAYGRGSTLVTAALSYSGIVFSALLGVLVGCLLAGQVLRHDDGRVQE